jgi:hypothetical protein
VVAQLKEGEKGKVEEEEISSLSNLFIFSPFNLILNNFLNTSPLQQ